MISQAGRCAQTPSATPLQPKRWNACFWIMFNFWWSARLVDGLEPHLPPVSSQNMKCPFLDYVQLLMIGRAGQWTQTPSTTSLQSRNEMLIFGLCSTSDDRPGWSMDSNPHLPPLSSKKMKCSFLDYVQLLMIGQAGQWIRTPSTTSLQPRNEMLVLRLWSTSDDRLGWLMDSNPIHHLSPAKKVKCSFLDYVQLLMIGCAIQATKVDWNMEKVPLSHPNMKYSFLYYVQLLMIGQAIRVTKVDQNAKKLHVISVRVFCCFSLGLLLFQSGSSLRPPPPDGKVGIRVAEKFRFFRFMFNKFQPKDNSVQSLLHLLAMQLICDGQCTNWFSLHFYNL